ncbi:hypothetical protein [Nocardioides maradonensis]
MKDHVDTIISLITLAGIALGWWRWARPRVKARADERKATNEVLLGRDAIPANPITGEPAQPAKPSIGQQVADQGRAISEFRAALETLTRLATSMHHELHPNGGSSLKDQATRLERVLGEVRTRLEDGDRRFDDQADRLERIETVLADELVVAADTLANAAEASKSVLRVIDTALHAEPPADLD